MLSLDASSLLTLAGIALAIYLLLRREGGQRQSDHMDRQFAELRDLIAAAHRESARLEAAIAKAESIGRAAPDDVLAAIESLADPAALADDAAISHVAIRTPLRHGGIACDLFEQNQKVLKVVRLVDQGHSPAEIARRMHLPIGEVELLLSIRSE